MLVSTQTHQEEMGALWSSIWKTRTLGVGLLVSSLSQDCCGSVDFVDDNWIKILIWPSPKNNTLYCPLWVFSAYLPVLKAPVVLLTWMKIVDPSDATQGPFFAGCGSVCSSIVSLSYWKTFNEIFRTANIYIHILMLLYILFLCFYVTLKKIQTLYSEIVEPSICLKK